ncbi:MAG TPA: DegQ family serine endoprotease [Clostridia bacterium]|nr:DegQ family serine endoprotease [Clostridia bacterium]
MNAFFKRNYIKLLSWAVMAGIGLQGMASAWAAPAVGKQKPGVTNVPPKLIIQDAPLSRDIKMATSFAPIAKKVRGSVVMIYSTTTIKERPMTDHPFFNDPTLRRFFGQDGTNEPRERKAQGLGSGVIVSPDGYILTANHVVEGADTVKVALATGDEEFDAKVIGNDPPTDVAVLKIEAKRSLPAISIADSDKLEVGDVVLAVGSPFGLGQTVTMGIVSALGRSGFGITAYENFIQTDAAINQGNSGGPLVDAEGRLVGISTAIFSRSGGFLGVGLAVPINIARYVMDRLVTEGKVTRGYLGVNIQPLTADLAKMFDLPDESSGVLVGGVSPDSAAQQAGVREGDIVMAVNGKKVTDPQTLQLIVSQTPPGSKVTLRVLRGQPGRKAVEKELSATLGELPQEALAMGSEEEDPEPDQSQMDGLDGVAVADLEPQVRRQFGIQNNVRGALVVTVDPNSNAAEAGLRPGDIIVEVNRKPVTNAQQAVELSRKAEGERILLRVWSMRGGMGGSRYVIVNNTK